MIRYIAATCVAIALGVVLATALQGITTIGHSRIVAALLALALIGMALKRRGE